MNGKFRPYPILCSYLHLLRRHPKLSVSLSCKECLELKRRFDTIKSFQKAVTAPIIYLAIASYLNFIME